MKPTLAQDDDDPASRWLAKLPAEVRAIVEEQSGGALQSEAPRTSALPRARELEALALGSVDTPMGRRSVEGNREERRAAEHVRQRGSNRDGYDARAAKRRRRRGYGYVHELARHRRRNDAWIKAHRERWRARREEGLEVPPAISLQLFLDCCDIAYDNSNGKAVRIHLSRIHPTWAAMIRRAALGELDNGECMRGWSSERARGIAICGLILCRSQRRTRRRGTYTCLVRGLTKGLFERAARGPRDRPRHLNTIAGVHRPGASAESSQLGYIDALERAGLCYRQRLPAELVETWEQWRGRDGELYACNRYWVANPNPYDEDIRADVRTALLQLASTALSAGVLRLHRRARPAPDAAAAAPASPPAPD